MTTLVLLAPLAAGCGVSPLLNHVNEDDSPTRATSAQPKSSQSSDDKPDQENTSSEGSTQAPSAPESTNEPCTWVLPKSGICARMNWTIKPGEDDYAEFVVKFSEAPAFNVAAKLWMRSMGHGSSPIEVVKESEDTYRFKRVFFSMPGGWELWLQQKQGAQVFEQAKIDLVIQNEK